MGLLNKMKYGVTGFTIGAIFFSGIAFGATSKIEVSFDPVKFIVNNLDKTPANGKFQNNGTSVPASLSYNGTIYVPLKMVGGMVDKKVGWDAKNKSVLIGNSAAERVYLTDLAPSKIERALVINEKVEIGKQSYQKGLTSGIWSSGTHSYKLNGEYKTLNFSYALSDEARAGASAKITIFGDGQELWSGIAAAGVPLHDASVSVAGVIEVDINIESSNSGKTAVVNPILTQ